MMSIFMPDIGDKFISILIAEIELPQCIMITLFYSKNKHLKV